MRIQANKQTLLAYRKNLQFLEKSLELLEYKRELLINEIRRRSLHADEEREEVNSNIQKAFQYLVNSFMDSGKNAIKQISQTALTHFNFKIQEYSFMGVVLTDITFIEEKMERPIDYGLYNTSVNLDNTLLQFQKTISKILNLATTETSIFRLMTELTKTQRRINALEKLFIPEYKTSIKKIGFILDEKERSNVSIIKILKERLGKEK